MSGGVDYLNLEYILLKIASLLTGVNVNASEVPLRVELWLQSIAWWGLVLSVIFLMMIVYVRIRTIIVEHEGFHMWEEKERKLREGKVRVSANPQWDHVMALAVSDDHGEWRRAIMEADVMLAALLIERGIPGDSVGEKLKNANPLQFTTLDLAWQAHKTRNAIAHLGEAFPLSERDKDVALDSYRRVFEEFHIL